MRKPKKQKPLNDLSRSLTPLDLKSWLVAGIVPGVERQPLKKLAADENGLLKLLERRRREAEKAGYTIDRITVAFEAGRDGFWLARPPRPTTYRALYADVGSAVRGSKMRTEHRGASAGSLFLGGRKGPRAGRAELLTRKIGAKWRPDRPLPHLVQR
jgi:transposase